MKYIDADKLIAEIERRKNRTERRLDNIVPIKRKDTIDEEQLVKIELRHKVDKAYLNGVWITLRDILSFIDSLQHEQPKFKVGDTIHKKGENTVFPMVIERISDGDYVCDNAHSFINIKYQDDYELVQQEQPEGYNRAMLEVKAKVDKLYDETSIGLSEYASGLYNGIAETCMKLRGFINARISSQEQPEVEFEKEYKSYMQSRKDDISGNAVTVNMKDLARHFWNKGYNARKEGQK